MILIDQLKRDLYRRRTRADRHPAILSEDQRKDYTVGAQPADQRATTRTRLLDCFTAAARACNWDGYCNPEIDKLIEQQSREGDAGAAQAAGLWTIERKLAEDVARPIIFYARGGTCWQPYVKGLTIMVNSIFNGWRMEDVWLDK